MKNKLTLVVVLVVVAIAYVLLIDPAGLMKPSEADVALSDTGKVVLCGLSEAEINAFTITKPDGESFKIERSGDKWFTVKGGKRYKAEANKLARLLSDVPGVSTDALLTAKADKHASFEVDDASGIKLAIEGAGLASPIELVVGKGASGNKGSFVRIGGGNEVYRSVRNLKSLVGFAFNDYRSKKPWEFDPLTVKTLSIRPLAAEGEDEAQAVTFTLNNGMWQKPDGEPGNQNKLAEIADKLSKMSASTFADEATAEDTMLAGLSPHLVVEAGGAEFSITIGAMTDGKYYIADGDGVAYEVSEYNLKFLLEQDIDALSFEDVTGEGAVAPETGPAG